MASMNDSPTLEKVFMGGEESGERGIEAGRGSNPSATIETTTSIMATSRQRPVHDGTVVSSTGDGLLGRPTTATRPLDEGE
jgi:hypothetical protein